MNIRAVLFDVIGTTVKEDDPTLVASSFEKAFADNQVRVDAEMIKQNRGRDKAQIIEAVINQQNLSHSLVATIYQSFQSNISSNLHHFQPNNGATEIFEYMRSQRIKIGVGTGLSRDLFEQIIHHLKWNEANFDYVGIANEIGAGRPDPAMIYDMMKKLNIQNPKHLLKVGDTAVDVQEGKNAGVITVAILSGTQPQALLESENPDYMIKELVELKKIV